MAYEIPHTEIMPARAGTRNPEMRRLAKMYSYSLYRTLIGCRNHHPNSVRSTRTGECVQCVADRFQHWKARHPEQARERTNGHLRALGKPPLSLS